MRAGGRYEAPEMDGERAEARTRAADFSQQRDRHIAQMDSEAPQRSALPRD